MFLNSIRSENFSYHAAQLFVLLVARGSLGSLLAALFYSATSSVKIAHGHRAVAAATEDGGGGR